MAANAAAHATELVNSSEVFGAWILSWASGAFRIWCLVLGLNVREAQVLHVMVLARKVDLIDLMH